MRKRLFVSVLIILALLFSCMGLIACDKKAENEEVDLVLNEKIGFKFVKWQNSLMWFTTDGAAFYEISVYSDDYKDLCVFSQKIEDNGELIQTVSLPDSLSQWRSLTAYIIAFTQESSYSSNIISTKIVYSEDVSDYPVKEPEDVITGENTIHGDGDYYYCTYSSKIDMLVNQEIDYAISLNQENKVTNVSMPAITSSDWSYDEECNLIVLKKEYIAKYSTGAKVPLTITYENGNESKTYISLVKSLPLNLDKNYLSYSRELAANDVVLNWTDKISNVSYSKVLYKVTVDDKIVPSGTWYKATSDNVTLYKTQLNGLSCGSHEIRFYYNYSGVDMGYSSVEVNVDAGNKTPYDVEIDYDSSYPNVYVNWNSDYTYDEAIVTIGGVNYSSKDSNYGKLFNGNSFNAANILSNKGTYVRVTLVYGEDYYTSEYKMLDLNLTDETVKKHLSNSFVYLGKNCNSFISSKSEFNDYIAYTIIHYGDSDTFRRTECTVQESYRFYSPYMLSAYTTDDALAQAIKDAYSDFIEPLQYSSSTLSIETARTNSDYDENEFGFSIVLRSGSARPYSSYNAYEGTADYKEYPNSQLHYYTKGESTRSSTFNGFKVDSIEKTTTVSTSVELYLALEAGLKPIPVANSNADKVYTKAKEILRKIVDDNMTDYEKVLAIYDYINYNTIYDRGMTTRSSKISAITTEYAAIYKNTSFYAEGVFFYKVAVCNGLAAAMSIMCNIEGIKTYKTMGKVDSGNHTWIKVQLDENWYTIDITWSNGLDCSGTQKYELIDYDFFMMSEYESESYNGRTEYTQYEAGDYYAGDGQYDYWASSLFTYNSDVYDLYITSKEEFFTLIDYYCQIGENRIIKAGETLQFSIKLNVLGLGNGALKVGEWLEEYYNNHATFNANFEDIVYFVRADLNNNTITRFQNVVYLRITGDA